MEKIKLELEIIEAPKGVFCAQIKNVRGAIVQSSSRILAIKEVFRQAWMAVALDSKNFKGTMEPDTTSPASCKLNLMPDNCLSHKNAMYGCLNCKNLIKV